MHDIIYYNRFTSPCIEKLLKALLLHLIMEDMSYLEILAQCTKVGSELFKSSISGLVGYTLICLPLLSLSNEFEEQLNVDMSLYVCSFKQLRRHFLGTL